MIWVQKTLLVTSLLALLVCTGCSSNNPASRYEPNVQTAKQAIETALNQWKSGAANTPIEGKPAINVFDLRWQSGSKLSSFTILDEVPGSEHPQFKVRILLEGAQEEINQYLVVGIDPLMVFRDEDYRRASGM